MTSCTYDTGSMYGCEPACSQRATHALTYSGYGGTFVAPLCARHVRPMQNRAYPYAVTVAKL